jgi:hypothetical protein
MRLVKVVVRIWRVPEKQYVRTVHRTETSNEPAAWRIYTDIEEPTVESE